MEAQSVNGAIVEGWRAMSLLSEIRYSLPRRARQREVVERQVVSVLHKHGLRRLLQGL